MRRNKEGDTMSEDNTAYIYIIGIAIVAIFVIALFPPDMLDIRPDREDPVADAGSDVTVELGSEVQLDGSSSSDDKGIVQYVWTIEEMPNVVIRRGERINHLFASPGTYRVSLEVIDGADKSDTDELFVTVITIE
jgi:hypothetical protein